jgi:hypothetical protein
MKDIWHLMDMVKVSSRHGLAREYSMRLRDAIFIVDEDDKRGVLQYLARKRISWEDQLARKPKWILRRVRRVVPPPEELYQSVENVFNSLGPLLCNTTQQPLFDAVAWKSARQVLSAIRAGHVSDPPGVSFYFKMGVDQNGLPMYRCCRGTNSVEGGIHQNVIRKFGSFGASHHLADCMLADYRLRHNMDVGSNFYLNDCEKITRLI